MLRRKWAIFLGDARHIGPRIENPGRFCRCAFLKENHVRFHALAVRSECAARQPQNGVQIAILHQNLEHFAGFAFKEAVIRQHHRGASAGLQRGEHVLHEVELLVAGFDGKIFALRRLVRAFGSERRIGQDHVVLLAAEWFVDRVAEINVRLDAVQK